MAISIDYVAQILTVYGGGGYGREPVSQLDHALQCAQLAEDAGENSSTVTAALLHDIGHLLQLVRRYPAETLASDDLHQYVALSFLRGLLPEAVLQPIRLHVDAKRYLCFVEPAYQRSLSRESQRSLKLQGGAFDSQAAAKFLAQPFAEEALRLRCFDDLAKDPAKRTRPLAHFLSLTAELSC